MKKITGLIAKTKQYFTKGPVTYKALSTGVLNRTSPAGLESSYLRSLKLHSRPFSHLLTKGEPLYGMNLHLLYFEMQRRQFKASLSKLLGPP